MQTKGRVFDDRDGREWHVSEDATGSLTFLSRGERRRIRETPPNWRTAPDSDLRSLLASAQLVSPAKQPV